MNLLPSAIRPSLPNARIHGCPRSQSFFRRATSLATCLLAAAMPASAASVTWNGSADKLWSNSSNWSGGPPALNDLYFNNTGASATAGTFTSIIDQSCTVNSLNFSNTQYQNLQLQAGANLNVSSGLNVGGNSAPSNVSVSGSENSLNVLTASVAYGNLNINAGTILNVSGNISLGNNNSGGSASLNMAPGAKFHLGKSGSPASVSVAANTNAYSWSTVSFAPNSVSNPDMGLYMSTLTLGSGYSTGTMDLTNYTGPLSIGTLNIGDNYQGTGQFVFGNATNNTLTFPSLSINRGSLSLNAGATLNVTNNFGLGYSAGGSASLIMAAGAKFYLGTPGSPASVSVASNTNAYSWSTVSFAPNSVSNPDMGLYMSTLTLGSGYSTGTMDLTNYTGPLSLGTLKIGGGGEGSGQFIFGNSICNRLTLVTAIDNRGALTVNKRSMLAVTSTMSISSSASIAVRVGGVSGGLSVENASGSGFSLAGGVGRMTIDFDDPDVRTANYYGFRWKGDHVSYLQSKVNQYGFTGDGGIKIVTNGAFVKNATLQISLAADNGVTYTYLGFNAQPNTQVLLGGATALDPAYLTGTASLPTPDTHVWSLELRDGSQLNTIGGDRLTALGGVMVDTNATLQGVGTIGGDLRNSGSMSLGSAGGIGTCNLLNNFTQVATGSLQFMLVGQGQGTGYDFLHIAGSATLGGTINVSLLGGFQPANHTKFDILTADAGITWDSAGIVVNLPTGFTWALVNGNTTLELSYDLYGGIAVEQPAGQNLTSGTAAIAYDALAIGSHNAKTITIRSTGGVTLNIQSVATFGSNPEDFIVSTEGMSSTIAVGASTSFSVAFTPTGNVSSPRAAVLRIANDDPNHSALDIALSGMAFSTTTSTTGDGLDDWTKYTHSALGFDWRVAQPDKVKFYLAGANSSNLYTPAQVQAMHVDAPLLEKDPNTGLFTLTIGLQKSTDLIHYSSFPVTMPQAAITQDGKLQLRFSVPDNAAFFRVEAK